MSTESPGIELGQFHRLERFEVFEEKDSHLREYKFATPRTGSVRPKCDPKTDYKCGVQTVLHQASHKANFIWKEPVVCMKPGKHRMKFKSGALQWDRDSDWHDGRSQWCA